MNKMEFLKIEDVTIAPKHDGSFNIMTDRYWVVTPDNEIMVHENGSPQCNKKRSIAMKFLDNKSYPEGCRLGYFPIVYLNHNCHDYV